MSAPLAPPHADRAPAPTGPPPEPDLLDPARLAPVQGWGMIHEVPASLVRPATLEQLAELVRAARTQGLKICPRGSGQSYGDAALRRGALVLDFSRMRRILDYDPETGRIAVEPGVTIADLWRYTIEDGWWPPVVSGTMATSLGGAAAMNIHGKNNYRAGTIGEHIAGFDLLTAEGEILRCRPDQESDIFYAAIGGFGMLGLMTRIDLQLKRIFSGELVVRAAATRSIEEMIDCFEANLDQDYLVGWIDCLAPEPHLGRGLVHLARHLAPGEDPVPAKTLRASHQELPETFFGVLPKSMLWLGLKVFLHRPGMRLVNAVKMWAGKREAAAGPYRQSHGAFNFLLDYVPNWKYAYRPGGLLQFQMFAPRDRAADLYRQVLREGRRRGVVPYLGVFKKHRPDPFLLTHGLDGYSLALDYPVRRTNRGALQAFLRWAVERTLEAGGRFYPAKDSVLRPEDFARSFGGDQVERFRGLKRQLDPEECFATALSRRLGLTDGPAGGEE